MRIVFLISAIILLSACSVSKRSVITRDLQKAEQAFQDHKGFALYDPEKKKWLSEFNSDRYFIPASNTKILTLYTGLKILGDSIPALTFEEHGDSLIFWGTGDPSFLNPYTATSEKIINFLKRTPHQLFFSSENFLTEHFGPGWAWNDYNYAYSAERSAFPMYGNVMKIEKPLLSDIVFEQPYFSRFVQRADSVLKPPYFKRDLGSNALKFFPGQQLRDMSWEVPFKYSPELIADLLTDTLKREVGVMNKFQRSKNRYVLYSVHADSLYKVMMQESDNFIAEQLLLICAGMLSDTLDTDIAIRYIQDKYFYALPDKPVWVDGSGLSRYNLITPRSVVKIWEEIYAEVDQQRLFSLLAIGGKAGTIKNLYKAEKPYIFGKTGTLRNNHSLSGFIKTKSGKILIFSFMNSAYTRPVAEVRTEMERILRYVRDKY